MVSILVFTLNRTVGEYRRLTPIDMVSTLRSDVAMVTWQDGEVRVYGVLCVGTLSREISKRCYTRTKVEKCGP